MKTAAIIAEYNPFHSGHKYHIDMTKKLYGATHIAAVMSGNFVQRGDCACISKQARTRMALLGGADLVLELPLPWAVAGAERFALGGVSLAQALGVAEMLSFGSESGDIDMIMNTARTVISPEITENLRDMMNGGSTFAAARAAAAESLLPGAGEILRSPNDTLGVEYCKAIVSLGAHIEPVCVRRKGAAHDGEVSGDNASASFIRGQIQADADVSGFIPPEALAPLAEELEAGRAPALLERLDRTVLYRLRMMSPEEMAQLPDVSEGLENRIWKCAREADSLAGLCDTVKVKRYTHARIRRIVLSALLGLTAQDAQGTPPYIRVLGMNERGREILHAMQPALPVITRAADAVQLDDRGRRILRLEETAADIFALTMPQAAPCGADAASGIIVL